MPIYAGEPYEGGPLQVYSWPAAEPSLEQSATFYGGTRTVKITGKGLVGFDLVNACIAFADGRGPEPELPDGLKLTVL